MKSLPHIRRPWRDPGGICLLTGLAIAAETYLRSALFSARRADHFSLYPARPNPGYTR
jgi:hypothetical protein